jgi:hypothetical protein
MHIRNFCSFIKSLKSLSCNIKGLYQGKQQKQCSILVKSATMHIYLLSEALQMTGKKFKVTIKCYAYQTCSSVIPTTHFLCSFSQNIFCEIWQLTCQRGKTASQPRHSNNSVDLTLLDHFVII